MNSTLFDLQIRQFGFSEIVGLVSYPEDDPQSRRPYSKRLHALMESEASKLVTSAYRKTEEVLLKNRDKLEKVGNTFRVETDYSA